MTRQTHPNGHPDRKQRTKEGGLSTSIPLGHWGGIEVDAHWSVLFTVVLFAAVLATGTLPEAHPGDTRTAYWLVAVGTSVVFFVTLLAHELAHALVARAYGMKVERITLWLLGGVSELGSPSPTARADALVALAGPATSLGIGAVGLILAAVVGTSGLAGTALVWLASISIGLAVFNLLPGAPLDGGRVLRAVVWWRGKDRDRAALVAARSGRVVGYALIALGLFNVIAGFPTGLWLALVGWFIVSGADAERAAVGDEHLSELKASDVMTPTPVLAPAWWTVQQFVAHLSPGQIAAEVFPVVDLDGHTSGVFTLADLEAIPAKHRVDTQLGAVAAHHVPPVIVAHDLDASEVATMIRPHGNVAVVERMEHPIGIITPLALARAARLSTLGWQTMPARGSSASTTRPGRKA